MNNFFVDIVCRAFTNIEEIHKAAAENKELLVQNEALKELKDLKLHWSEGIDKIVDNNISNYDTQIMQKHKQLETEAENFEWESLNRALTQNRTTRQKSMTSLGFGFSQRQGRDGLDGDEPALGESIFGDSMRK